MCRVRIGDWPTRMPATNAPSTVCTPIASVVSAINPVTTRIAVMTGHLADKPVVRPTDHPKYQPPADSEAENEKDRGADEALRERRKINPAMQRQPERSPT